MGNVIGLIQSRTGIAIGRLLNAQLRQLAPSKLFLFRPQIQCRRVAYSLVLQSL